MTKSGLGAIILAIGILLMLLVLSDRLSVFLAVLTAPTTGPQIFQVG